MSAHGIELASHWRKKCTNALGYTVEQEAHHLLLVEDDNDLLTSTATLLRMKGWNVTTASDGQCALDKLRAGFSPHILLTDYMMPRMDGLALLEAIREDPLLPNPPVVLVTAATLPAAVASKFDGFITKPFALDDLHSTLQRLILQLHR